MYSTLLALFIEGARNGYDAEGVADYVALKLWLKYSRSNWREYWRACEFVQTFHVCAERLAEWAIHEVRGAAL